MALEKILYNCLRIKTFSSIFYRFAPKCFATTARFLRQQDVRWKCYLELAVLSDSPNEMNYRWTSIGPLEVCVYVCFCQYSFSFCLSFSGSINNSRRSGRLEQMQVFKSRRAHMKDTLFSAPHQHRRSANYPTRPWWIAMGFFFQGDTRNESQLALLDGCFPSQSVSRSHADRQDANCKSLRNVTTGRHAPTNETWLFSAVKPADDKRASDAPIVLCWKRLVSIGKLLPVCSTLLEL